MGALRVGSDVDHACHVYEDDASLSATVAAFLAPAFSDGHAVLSIGTRGHLAAIEQRLRTDGHDVDGARTGGRYVTVDAERVMSRLLCDGLPTTETFEAVVGVHVARLAERHHGVRAFGELVSLLLRDGKRAAALRLEDLWNEALGYHPLSLLCGYSARAMRRADRPDDILRAHSRVIPRA